MTTPDRPGILSFFDSHIRIDAVDPKGILGELLDDLLGFSDIDEQRNPEADMPGASPESWRVDLANYGSTAEYRLQALSQSILSFARNTWRDDSLPSPDSICVRIVEREHASPSTQSAGGYHYIIIPSGFIKSLENLWRVQFSLAEKGKKRPASKTEIDGDRIGGASVERSLTADFRNSWRDLDSIFIDAGWHRWFNGPLIYPESVLAAGARITAEFHQGMYSTEGKLDSEYRLPSTRQSRWLARLVLAYILAHEVAHVILRHEGPEDEAGRFDVETLCDLLATSYFPYFIEHDSKGWAPAHDGGTEHLSGIFGFFAAVQIRETVGLILGLFTKEFTEGSDAFDAISSRMTEIERRAMDQVGVLSRTLQRDPAMLTFATAVLSEFQALLVGVQMVGTRTLMRKQTSFASHFRQWQRSLQDHLAEMSSQRTGETGN